jgi:protein SCO1/2
MIIELIEDTKICNVKSRRKIMNVKFIIQCACILVLGVFSSSCQEPLPIFGQREVIIRETNGKQVTDTVYHTIAPFRFVNQDGTDITNETFKGKIYVADFFFTSCRTICPIMKTQMVRVYEQVQDDPDVLILSHTIDPEYDTVGLLHDFANRLGVKSSKWHFATGQPNEYVFDLAQKSYFATAMEDKTEPDGFIHSGAFLLIDRQGRIRGKYDGTKEDDVNRLMKDIKRLERE